jgi:hypothetical protein
MPGNYNPSVIEDRGSSEPAQPVREQREDVDKPADHPADHEAQHPAKIVVLLNAESLHSPRKPCISVR